MWLGPLKDIESVSSENISWRLRYDSAVYPKTMTGKAGTVMQVPYMPTELKQEEVSFFEIRRGTYIANLFDQLSLKNGFLHIGPLPAGVYELLLKDIDKVITITLVEGIAPLLLFFLPLC